MVDTLFVLAANTGGNAVVNTNDLAGALRRVADTVSTYYLLGYYSSNTKFNGEYRTIEVRLREGNRRVDARPGYFAPTDAIFREATAGGAAGRRDGPGPPSAAAPVGDALAVLARLRASEELFTYAVATAGEVVVTAEIASRLIELGRWARGADVRVTVRDLAGERAGAAGATIEPGARGALVRVPMPPGAAGPWHVEVRVEGEAGRLDDRLDVRPAAGRLLGEPVLYRAPPAARAPLRPVADFQYRRVERVHIEWPILGPLDRRDVRVLDRRGQPLSIGATVTERATAGRPMLTADVTLGPLTDGDYVIEVVAGQGTETERQFVAIRVSR
jgi:hypothetical protein